jgi:predicted transposase/invertase (TIGR01784 family)
MTRVVPIPEEIFPEYYIIKVTAFAERVRDKFDEWVYFLKHGKVEKEFNAQGIQSAAHKLDVLQLNEADRRAYERFRESLHDGASWALTMNVLQARLEATESAKTKAEAKLEKVALRLLKEGLSDEKIAAITDLPIEKIKDLRSALGV